MCVCKNFKKKILEEIWTIIMKCVAASLSRNIDKYWLPSYLPLSHTLQRIKRNYCISGYDLTEMEKEAKKEAFRKYLESSGVLDSLTKVLVALYEQNDKPSSAIEFIQQKLGGATAAEYEKLQSEVSEIKTRYNELLAAHLEKCREYEELKITHAQSLSKEMNKEEGAIQEGL